MAISNINRVRSIAIPLSSNNGSAVFPIYQNPGIKAGDQLLPGYTVISFNCFIKNLKLFASVQSLDPVPMPEFTEDDTDTTKLYKTLDLEWRSPRKQLTLYLSVSNPQTPDSTTWLKVGSISLLNPSGYPYRVYNLMDLFTDNLAIELGENSKVGVSVDNVGFGLLTDSDTVTIHGSYAEEIFVESKDASLTYSTGVQAQDFSLSNQGSLDNNFILSN